MKKVLCAVVAVLMMLSVFGVVSFAEGTQAAEPIDVYVTISDGEGKLVVTQEKITVNDVNSDGKLDIDEALYAAHEAEYEGGASAGYASYVGSWGLAIEKLWGIQNGGSYGYYVNNASANGLSDAVNDGDHINAYIFTDTTAYSDMYCFFDANTKTVDAGDSITLTLSGASFDESYAPITVPVKDAVITVNGVATSYKTDAEGKVTLTLDKAGDTVISAVSDTQVLVPPVCKVTVNETAPVQTDDTDTAPADTVAETAPKPEEEKSGCASAMLTSIFAVAAVSGLCAVGVKRRNRNEE